MMQLTAAYERHVLACMRLEGLMSRAEQDRDFDRADFYCDVALRESELASACAEEAGGPLVLVEANDDR